MPVSITNEGTKRIWLPEDRVLKLTVLELGWLWGILNSLDRERGDAWPTAIPAKDGSPIPTTMPRRICKKLMDLMEEQ